jgi:hypothetical protein
MHRKMYLILAGTMLSMASMAFADDAPSAQPVKTPKQKMHDCMVQESANSSTMSKEDLKKACAAKLQSEENHPSRPKPLTDAQH